MTEQEKKQVTQCFIAKSDIHGYWDWKTSEKEKVKVVIEEKEEGNNTNSLHKFTFYFNKITLNKTEPDNPRAKWLPVNCIVYSTQGTLWDGEELREDYYFYVYKRDGSDITEEELKAYLEKLNNYDNIKHYHSEIVTWKKSKKVETILH